MILFNTTEIRFSILLIGTLKSGEKSMRNQLSDLLKINHYALLIFPYWNDTLLKNWEKAVLDLLIAIQKGITLAEFYQELMKLASLLNDGHTMVYLPKEIKESLNYLPLTLSLIEEELVITSADDFYKDFLYQPIKKINQQTTKEYLDQIKLFSWPHQPSFSLKYHQLLTSLFYPANEITIEFESEEKLLVPFQPKKFNQFGSNVLKNQNEIDIYYETDSIVIAKIRNKMLVKIKHFMTEDVVSDFYHYLDDYLRADELIFDLRGNPGGNSGLADQIAQAFFDQPLEMEKSYRQVIDGEKIASASMALYSKKQQALTEQEKSQYQIFNHQFLESRIEKNQFLDYQGVLKDVKVTILQDELTYSSAENFIINFDNQKRALILGERTAGSTGQPAWIELKTGGMFMITAKRVEYPNGKKHHNIGINPDVLLPKTIENQQVNRDFLLEYVLNN